MAVMGHIGSQNALVSLAEVANVLTSQPFELFLLDHKDQGQVIALARRGADTAIELLPIGAAFQDLVTFGRMVGGVASGVVPTRPDSAALVKFGGDLFQFLFQGSLRQIYMGLPQGPVTLQILSNRVEVKEVPWEFLVTPDRAPAPHRERSIVRVQPTIGIEFGGAKRLKKTLKVLVVAADPANEPGVGWEDIASTIDRALAMRLPEEAKVTLVPGADRAQLLKVIAKERFDVFHFIGHGDVNAQGVGGLVLENVDKKSSEFMRGAELAVALAGKGIHLAILSACSSSGGNRADDFGSVATSLIAGGIPAVVANQFPISYRSLAPFLGSLYLHLFQYGNIDLAVAEGRVALAVGLANKTDAAVLEWGLPTLHRLANAKQLFKVAP